MPTDEKKVPATLTEFEAKVALWVGSKEGQETLIETTAEAKAAAEFVREEAKIDPDRLRRPVTH